jgi:hypothetical protein
VRIGLPARAAVSRLRSLVVEDPDVPISLVYALACLSEEDRAGRVGRVVADALSDEAPRSHSALFVVSHVGRDAPPAVLDSVVSRLVDVLRSERVEERRRAARALSRLAPGGLARAAAPALEQAIDDVDPETRGLARGALDWLRE